jgi:hypothetical protein
MKRNFLLAIFLFHLSLFSSQQINKIEFHHSNAVILFRSVDIVFQPIKNNRKGKVRIQIKKDRYEKYTYRISKEKFEKINSAILKIEYDTVAVKENSFDNSSSDITLYDNLGGKKSFFATGLNKASQTNIKQKDFCYATKLIMNAAKLKMEDLIGYR